jgi:hypothetical protein
MMTSPYKPKERIVFAKIDNAPQYQDFDQCVKDLKRRYRATHRGGTEGLHFEFVVLRLPDGRSGFLKAERLENASGGMGPPTEAVVIENNRVTSRITYDPKPSMWIG